MVGVGEGVHRVRGYSLGRVRNGGFHWVGIREGASPRKGWEEGIFAGWVTGKGEFAGQSSQG